MEEIKKKGFAMTTAPVLPDTGDAYNVVDFSKIKVGLKTLDDAILDNVGEFKKANPRLGDKHEVMRAIENLDYATMRDISNFFFKTSGIYSRLCRYMAYLYRYAWMVTPYVNEETANVNQNKILQTFYK